MLVSTLIGLEQSLNKERHLALGYLIYKATIDHMGLSKFKLINLN